MFRILHMPTASYVYNYFYDVIEGDLVNCSGKPATFFDRESCRNYLYCSTNVEFGTDDAGETRVYLWAADVSNSEPICYTHFMLIESNHDDGLF